MMAGREPQNPAPPPVVDGFEHIRRFWQPDYESFVAKVLPGQYYVSRGGEWIITVLGSCVSACVRDPVRRVGGMNHFMLPHLQGGERWNETRVNPASRYGSYAMEHMINDILKLGGQRRRLEVKIVGGGRILDHGSDIGARNIDFVRAYLGREGLLLSGEHLGGDSPRKVYYDVVSGRVRVKLLPVQDSQAVASEELGYRRVIERGPVTGDVELFR